MVKLPIRRGELPGRPPNPVPAAQRTAGAEIACAVRAGMRRPGAHTEDATSQPGSGGGVGPGAIPL